MIASKCVDLQGRKMNLKIPSSVVGPSAFCEAMIYLWVWRFGPWLGSLLFVSPKEMRNKRKAKRLDNNLLLMEDVLWFMFMVHVYVVGFIVFFLESF